MTIYQQIKTIMEGREDPDITSAYLKNEMKNKYGVNPGSVIPSDYCYNRTNYGIKCQSENRIFEYLGRGEYKYLGEQYPYTGEICQKRQGSKKDVVVGAWRNGKMKSFS